MGRLNFEIFEIPENQPVGTEVYTVTASDPDDKDEVLRYSIIGGDGMGYFTIDAKGVQF